MAIPSDTITRIHGPQDAVPGSDLNGGGFSDANKGATGVDGRASAPVAFTVTTNGSTTITATAGAFANTMLGSIINIAEDGGAGVPGFYCITAFTNSTTVTVDRVTTSSAAGLAARVGGPLASIGTAGLAQVPGNKLYIKAAGTTVTAGAASATQTVGSTTGMVANQTIYFRTAGVWRLVSSVTDATTVVLTATVTTTTGETVDVPYMSTNATSNVTNGRMTTATATAALPVTIRGFEVTEGDLTDRRPVLQWGVNAGTQYLITCSGAGLGSVENLVLHGNVGQYTGTSCLSVNNWLVIDCKLMNTATFGWTGSAVFYASELTNFTSALNSTSTSQQFIGCTIHDSVGLITPTTGTTRFRDCLVCNLTGAVAVCSNSLQLEVDGCTFYGFTGSVPAFSLTAAPTFAMFRNSHFENGTDYGIKTAAAYPNVHIRNCSGFNNTTAFYNTANILSYHATGIVAPTISPFVSATTADFRLNKSGAGGRLLIAAGTPSYFPGMTWRNYKSIGGSGLNGAAAGGGGPFQPF